MNGWNSFSFFEILFLFFRNFHIFFVKIFKIFIEILFLNIITKFSILPYPKIFILKIVQLIKLV